MRACVLGGRELGHNRRRSVVDKFQRERYSVVNGPYTLLQPFFTTFLYIAQLCFPHRDFNYTTLPTIPVVFDPLYFTQWWPGGPWRVVRRKPTTARAALSRISVAKYNIPVITTTDQLHIKHSRLRQSDKRVCDECDSVIPDERS